MGIKNKTLLTWILPSCFKATISHKIDPRIHVVSIHNSNSRISLCDLSDPGSPLCLSDLSNSKFASNLHIFTLSELKVMTSDFSSTNFLGEGGFGPVYKGFVDDKCRPGLDPQPIAVKLLDLDGDQGHREWLTEVVLLGQLKHPHLVKLIGYCCEDEQRLLVYEYMARGNLENHLFRRYSTSLNWETRIKIALGAAKGLAFLHGEEKPVIYRDFKTSNILLDSDYNAKLSDFGLAKDGPEGDETHVSTRIMGTHGYAAPEYIMTGHLTNMSDVYSFGVVLLELLTGRRAMDKKRPPREQNLIEWAKPYLKDHHKLDNIIDQRLEGQYSTEGARKVAALAYQCLSHSPKCRPSMSRVVKILEPIMQLRDIPFVYIAPSEEKEDAKINEHKINRDRDQGEGQGQDQDQDEEKSKKEAERKQRKKGYRHKHPMRARAVYTDTHLYRTYKNEICSVRIEGR